VPEFQLEHVNIPSKDPHQLANWYAQTFGLTADKHIVRGDGVLIAFQQGEPINRPDVLHIGFKVDDMSKLNEWFEKFENAQLKTGPEFTSFQVMDPEGNCVEIYTRNSN
jgi:catechol-2,3-dioxygenase